MTLSIAVVDKLDVGRNQEVVADVTFDSSYPTGGESLTGAMLGMRIGDLKSVQVDPVAAHMVRFVPNANGRQGLLKVLRTQLRNGATTSPGLAIGTGSKAKVKVVNTVTFFAAGVLKTRTSVEIAFTPTTHDIAPDAVLVKEAVYAVTVDASLVGHLTMGAIASGAAAAVPPAGPAGEALLGYVRVAVAAGATLFDASSDNLDAAHLAVTYTDAIVPPDGYVNGNDALAEIANTTNMSGFTFRVRALGR